MIEIDLQPELSLRWQKIKDAMKKTGVEACIFSSPTNLYYTAGRVFNGYAYFTADNDPVFFVRRPLGLKNGNICYIRKPEDMSVKLPEMGGSLPGNLALEADSLTFNEYMRLSAVFPQAEKLNCSELIRNVRAVKTPYEIEQLRESGKRHAAVSAHVTAIYEEGMSDEDISIKIESYARSLGNLGLFRIFGSSMEIFMGSVLAGENADSPSPYDFALGGEGCNASLPIGANGTILKPGETLMVDIGGNFTGYMTDMTRVYSIRKIDNELANRAHQTSIDIHDWFRENAKEGVAAADVYNKSMEMVKERGLERYFMGHKQQSGFVGHGVGIEVNELPVLAPRSKQILEAGNVIALEPKFVIPEVGAVGIENTYVITKDGVEQLTIYNEEIIELI